MRASVTSLSKNVRHVKRPARWPVGFPELRQRRNSSPRRRNKLLASFARCWRR
jgi:hypothetical protein